MIRTRVKKAEKQETVSPEVYPTEQDVDAVLDHGLHVEDETCARCGRAIQPSDEARKTANGDCVHLSC